MPLRIRLLCCLLVLFAVACAFGQAKRPVKTKVLVLGTFHMGETSDLIKKDSDDMLTPKRQEEVKSLVASPTKFRPTRIAVEASYVDHEKLNREYRSYTDGGYKPTRNEIDQIAFRLASAMRHKEIYPVDWSGKFDLAGAFAYAARNEQQEISDEFFKTGRDLMAQETEILKRGTISQVFKNINSKAKLSAIYSGFLNLSKIGKGPDYPGADVLADWSERNLKIFVNILRITESVDDRIFVLIGAAHVRPLEHLLESSGRYEVVDARAYL